MEENNSQSLGKVVRSWPSIWVLKNTGAFPESKGRSRNASQAE